MCNIYFLRLLYTGFHTWTGSHYRIIVYRVTRIQVHWIDRFFKLKYAIMDTFKQWPSIQCQDKLILALKWKLVVIGGFVLSIVLLFCVCFYGCVFLIFFIIPKICHNIICFCLFMPKSMFSAEYDWIVLNIYLIWNYKKGLIS